RNPSPGFGSATFFFRPAVSQIPRSFSLDSERAVALHTRRHRRAERMNPLRRSPSRLEGYPSSVCRAATYSGREGADPRQNRIRSPLPQARPDRWVGGASERPYRCPGSNATPNLVITVEAAPESSRGNILRGRARCPPSNLHSRAMGRRHRVALMSESRRYAGWHDVSHEYRERTRCLSRSAQGWWESAKRNFGKHQDRRPAAHMVRACG